MFGPSNDAGRSSTGLLTPLPSLRIPKRTRRVCQDSMRDAGTSRHPSTSHRQLRHLRCDADGSFSVADARNGFSNPLPKNELQEEP